MTSKKRTSDEANERPSETNASVALAPKPMVSIGLPVYNGARTINASVTSLLRQSFHNFELIISDNASTDNTLEICEAAARSDGRVRIIRQQQNKGAIANFDAVLKAARGDFFMFAAADDWVELHFIEETLGVLDSEPEAVACVPRTLIHLEGGRCREALGSAPIDGPAWWRPARFLLRPADNSRFYGLYRIAALRAAYLSDNRFHAFDWAVSALTLAQGAHLQSRSIILHRRGAGSGKYHRELVRNTSRFLDRLFPLARMSATLLARLSRRQLLLTVPVLFVLNAQKCAEHLLASVRAHRYRRLGH